MLDRHAVHELVRVTLTAREIAKQMGVSVRTVRRIVREGAVPTSDDAAARSARQVGRPRVTEAIRARVQALVRLSIRSSQDSSSRLFTTA